MGQVCILTDNSAQFPTASFPGHKLVNVIPLHIRVDSVYHLGGKGIKGADLPPSTLGGLEPEVLPPTVEEFQQMYGFLSRKYDEVVVLLISSHLLPVIDMAQEAAESMRGVIDVHIVDSRTMAVGLGLLTQVAAKAAAEGLPGADIVRLLRGLLPHIYCMFCLPGLTYLQHSGLLGPAQAIVGEKLGVMPLFILEEGRLVPVQKARSSRHLIDCLHEFVNEFADIQHIAIVQGIPPFEQEVRSLRERFADDHGAVPVSEHTIGPAVAALLGPHSLGIFVMEG